MVFCCCDSIICVGGVTGVVATGDVVDGFGDGVSFVFVSIPGIVTEAVGFITCVCVDLVIFDGLNGTVLYVVDSISSMEDSDGSMTRVNGS